MINRQQYKADCGPVSVYNALRDNGIRCSYDEIIDMSYQHTTFDYDGMWAFEVSRLLRLSGLTIKTKKNVILKDIEKALDQNKTIILLYRWYHKGRNGGHFVYINDHTKKKIKVYNSSKENKTPWINKSTLSEYIRYSNRHHRPWYTYMYTIS
jgi:hypothetical protein